MCVLEDQLLLVELESGNSEIERRIMSNTILKNVRIDRLLFDENVEVDKTLINSVLFHKCICRGTAVRNNKLNCHH